MSERTASLTDEKTGSSLGHVPAKDRWEFDASVTDVFEDMLRRSIPAYDEMRRLSFELGQRFVVKGTDVMDIGASRGDAVAPFIRKYGAQNHFELTDVSEPMLDALRDRFGGLTGSNVVTIRNLDLRDEFPPGRASLILCVLTLQFTPIEYRLKILRNARQTLIPGGALVLVEKILGATADFDDAFVEVYYDLKRRNGYTEDEIQRKRLALEGVLVPVTARMNEEFLTGAGFREVDCFWRWANFAGWIAVRTG